MKVKKYGNNKLGAIALVGTAIAFAFAFAFAFASPVDARASSIRCGSPPICPGGMSRMCVCDPRGRNCAWVCVD